MVGHRSELGLTLQIIYPKCVSNIGFSYNYGVWIAVLVYKDRIKSIHKMLSAANFSKGFIG